MATDSEAEVATWYSDAYDWLNQVGKDPVDVLIDKDGMTENAGFVKILGFLSDKVSAGDLQVVHHLHSLEVQAHSPREEPGIRASLELAPQCERISSFKDMARMMLVYGEYIESESAVAMAS